MALIRTGAGVTDIRGKFGGVYFHRDRFGLHSARMPRNIHRRSAAQSKQRAAFSKSRRWSKNNRIVSYNIYRTLNSLPFLLDAEVTNSLSPNTTGYYNLTGTYNNKSYYRRGVDFWFIWWNDIDRWYISATLGAVGGAGWQHIYRDVDGEYTPLGGASGTATVNLKIQEPPIDYYPDMR